MQPSHLTAGRLSCMCGLAAVTIHAAPQQHSFLLSSMLCYILIVLMTSDPICRALKHLHEARKRQTLPFKSLMCDGSFLANKEEMRLMPCIKMTVSVDAAHELFSGLSSCLTRPLDYRSLDTVTEVWQLCALELVAHVWSSRACSSDLGAIGQTQRYTLAVE